MEKKLQKTSCRLRFITSTKFMAGSLQNLFNNIADGIHTVKFAPECQITREVLIIEWAVNFLDIK